MRKLLLRTIGGLNAWIYQVSDGKLLGRFPGGAPVCLLMTKGRKSGQLRTVPLLYLADGEDLVVVASQGGAPQDPGWYFNLLAAPVAQVQLGGKRVAVTATQVDAEEKAALWPKLVAIYPPYADYQRKTTREIPVMRLHPHTSAA